jgi:hypothetical protein
MTVAVARKYAGPSQFTDGTLGLSTDEMRPVRFHGRVVEHIHSLRLALQTLGELVWSDHSWMTEEEYTLFLEKVLDPVITVHPDRVFFEAFSQDQSAYGVVIADRGIFESAGEVRCGTTNVDFTETLHAAMNEMRSDRETWFRVGPSGFGVDTTVDQDAALEKLHFEEKVDLPESWVRGFLQLQGAMAMPGTRFEVRPVDFKTMVRWLAEHRAHTSPRSVRWEFQPGEDVRAVLEPWEESVTMVNAGHNYTEPKTTRIWGRKGLKLIEPLLGYASNVEIYLKGRALPSFYAVELPGVTFVLGLSGWITNHWSQEASFDLLTQSNPERAWVDRALAHLSEVYHTDPKRLAEAIDCDLPTATQTLSELCRLGRAIYDVRAREYRHRELFAEPIDPEDFFPPDPRIDAAEALVETGEVTLESDTIREKRKIGPPTEEGGEPTVTTFRDRVLDGVVSDESTHVVVQDTGRIIFGRCTCEFFDENLMNRGPCEHMLALRTAAR